MEIFMKHIGVEADRKPYVVQIKLDDYKEYQNVLLKSGYKKWAKEKIFRVAGRFIPGMWMGVRVRGRLVGVCAAEFGPGKNVRDVFSARIAALAVMSEYRGKGFATDIVSSIIRKLYDYEYKSIYVAVHKENLPAVKVYKKCGFKKIK